MVSLVDSSGHLGRTRAAWAWRGRGVGVGEYNASLPSLHIHCIKDLQREVGISERAYEAWIDVCGKRNIYIVTYMVIHNNIFMLHPHL